MSRYAEEAPPQERPAPCNAIEQVIQGRSRDLGDGFSVRRVLPFAKRRMVGPFIFFDHMGPVEFPPGGGVDVRPHPHINLATLTWLFEGGMRHRDSLGNDMVIRPGAVNWMTAGRGIVHSERTDESDRAAGHRLHGIQSWVALPEDREETDPAFFHHPPDGLPRIERDGAHVTVIAGEAYGETSPVESLSPILYFQADLETGAVLNPPDDAEERAVYVVSGETEIAGAPVAEGEMAVLRQGAEAPVKALTPARLMVLGGAPLPERKIWWNFVSHDPDRIERAKRDWAEAAEAGFPQDGPFTLPPGESEHIPLPEK